MERLLAKKGIEMVSHIDEDGARVSYAFTEKMLHQHIVVVLTEHNGDWYYDTDEEGEEEWEEETTEATTEATEMYIAEEEEEYEEEEEEEIDLEGWEEENAAETTISVVFTQEEVAYDFTICVDNRPAVPVIYLYGIIKELVEIISESNPADFMEDLEAIATGVSPSNEFEEDPEFCQYLYELGAGHISKAASLLEERKSN